MKKLAKYTGIFLLLWISLPSHPALALDSRDIQHQIDALPASGGTITIPAGQHILTTANGSLDTFHDGTPIKTAILINKDNVTIQGQGPTSILKLAPHSKMRILAISAKNFTLKNIRIDGNRDNRNGSLLYPGGDTVDSLIYSNKNAANLLFENTEVTGTLETGIGSFLSTNVTIRNCYIHDNGSTAAGGSAIGFSGTIEGIAVNNRLEKNHASGLWITFDAHNIQVSNNTIRDNNTGGITIGAASQETGLGAGNSGFTVENNTLSGNGLGNGHGGFPTITIISSSDGVIKGNTITNSPYDNIQITGTAAIHSKNWQISNNTCGGPALVGIKRVEGKADNITLKFNKCQANLTQQTWAGDFNNDGSVNTLDYNILVTKFRNPYTILDYNALVANFGK